MKHLGSATVLSKTCSSTLLYLLNKLTPCDVHNLISHPVDSIYESSYRCDMFTAHVRSTMGGYFSVCLSVHTRGGGGVTPVRSVAGVYPQSGL